MSVNVNSSSIFWFSSHTITFCIIIVYPTHRGRSSLFLLHRWWLFLNHWWDDDRSCKQCSRSRYCVTGWASVDGHEWLRDAASAATMPSKTILDTFGRRHIAWISWSVICKFENEVLTHAPRYLIAWLIVRHLPPTDSLAFVSSTLGLKSGKKLPLLISGELYINTSTYDLCCYHLISYQYDIDYRH